MRRLITMLVSIMLAASLLTATAEARGGGGGGHIGGFGGGHMGGFGGGAHIGAIGGARIGGFGAGRIGFGDHGVDRGLHQHAMHRFGGVWPGYSTGLLDDDPDCYGLYYRHPITAWPPYCS